MCRVHECLSTEMPPSIVDELCSVTVDISEVETAWWNESLEVHETVVARMQDMLAQIRFCAEESIIVVGHSHYFREVFKEFIHPDFDQEASELSDNLKKLKLMNAGVVKLDVDYDLGERIITNVELLFDTQLVK